MQGADAPRRRRIKAFLFNKGVQTLRVRAEQMVPDNIAAAKLAFAVEALPLGVRHHHALVPGGDPSGREVQWRPPRRTSRVAHARRQRCGGTRVPFAISQQSGEKLLRQS